uniref:Uncharacterized protein n=1 Tax=Brassica oleracea var. oleracea TaxID=109376 RepID=A0A0D3BZR3_BRAOL
RAYTNKKTGQIDDGLVREVVTLVQTQVQDKCLSFKPRMTLRRLRPNCPGFESTKSLNPRRTRSVPLSSAPPPIVDPEVLTAQLKDKDDRISLLETQMAAQQLGYEAQRSLNQQMMEMMQRMYPNEVFPDVPDPDSLLGIFRGFKFQGNEPSEYSEGHIPRNIPTDLFLGIFRVFISSEIPDENSEEHFVETSEVYRGTSPSVYSEELSDELVVLGVSSEICFLGIPSENSEGFLRKKEFPRSYFRGLVSL